MNKGDIVRIKAMEGVSEYLHGLDGKVLKVKVQPIRKRTVKSNWNPVKVGSQRVLTVDLKAHNHIPEIADSMSKKFQLPESMLEKV